MANHAKIHTQVLQKQFHGLKVQLRMWVPPWRQSQLPLTLLYNLSFISVKVIDVCTLKSQKFYSEDAYNEI